MALLVGGTTSCSSKAVLATMQNPAPSAPMVRIRRKPTGSLCPQTAIAFRTSTRVIVASVGTPWADDDQGQQCGDDQKVEGYRVFMGKVCCPVPKIGKSTNGFHVQPHKQTRIETNLAREHISATFRAQIGHIRRRGAKNRRQFSRARPIVYGPLNSAPCFRAAATRRNHSRGAARLLGAGRPASVGSNGSTKPEGPGA